MVIVAGMMRRGFATSGVVTVRAGVVSGLGVGAFLITPWVAMNYAFAMRHMALTVIDGVNAVVGCAIMGAILTMFLSASGCGKTKWRTPHPYGTLHPPHALPSTARVLIRVPDVLP